jgi:acyl-CoA thioesterase-2
VDVEDPSPLDLAELDRDLFRAQNPPQTFLPHLYGGQVAAQAARAASLTVPEGRFLHSLHGYFLRPGRSDRPTILRVDRDRDGGSFSARHVNALQNGEVILSLLVSFHVDKEGREFQEAVLPSAMPPDEIPEQEIGGHNTMFDLRPASGSGPSKWPGLSHRFWARTRGALPDDRLIHECVLTFLSDMGTGFMKVPTDEPMGGPSLDHALWFHRPARLDEWVLVDLEPVVASGARAFYTGAVYDTAGLLVASLTQEHLMIPRVFGSHSRLDHAVGARQATSSSVRPSSSTNTSWLCSPSATAHRCAPVDVDRGVGERSARFRSFASPSRSSRAGARRRRGRAPSSPARP